MHPAQTGAQSKTYQSSISGQKSKGGVRPPFKRTEEKSLVIPRFGHFHELPHADYRHACHQHRQPRMLGTGQIARDIRIYAFMRMARLIFASISLGEMT